MPGRNDRGHAGASAASPFVLHRTVSAVDANVDAVSQIIDLTAAHTALSNVIVVVAKRTAGSGSVNVRLLRNTPDSSLQQDWVVTDEQEGLDHLDEVWFSDLYAGRYKLMVTALTAGATWQLHESHLTF